MELNYNLMYFTMLNRVENLVLVNGRSKLPKVERTETNILVNWSWPWTIRLPDGLRRATANFKSNMLSVSRRTALTQILEIIYIYRHNLTQINRRAYSYYHVSKCLSNHHKVYNIWKYAISLLMLFHWSYSQVLFKILF